MTAAPADRRMLRDVLMTYGGKTVGMIAAFATTVAIARFLGPAGRGGVAVAFGLTQVLVQVGTGGIVTANAYFAARGAASPSRLVGASLIVIAVVTPLLIGAGVVLRLYVPSATRGLSWAQLAIALAGMPALLGAQFLQSILLGERRVRAYNGVDAGGQLLTLVALLIGLAVFDVGPTGAIVIMVGSAYLGVLACMGVLALGGTVPRAPNVELMRRLFAYGFRVYLVTMLGFLLIRVDLLLVNGYLGTRVAGIYSIVGAIAAAVYLLPAAVGLNLFTRIAGGSGAHLTAAVMRIAVVGYGVICLLSIPAVAVGIKPVFGAKFVPAVDLYYWIAPGVYRLGLLTILSNHFAGRGFPREVIVSWLVGVGVCLALDVAFLSHGAWVASFASSVGYTIVLAFHVAMFAREDGGYRSMIPTRADARALIALVPRLVPRGAASR
jgi:O-antigen/teichoic acid export membrane protein